MTLNPSMRYLFLLRDATGENIAARAWNGDFEKWETRRYTSEVLAGYGNWRVIRSPKPLWRGGPTMVLEVEEL